MLNKDAIQSDIEIIKKYLFDYHPGFNAYNSKESFEEFFKEKLATYPDSITSLSFYRSLLPLHKILGNGHTLFLPPRSYYDSLRTSKKMFPLNLFADQNGIFVLQNLSTDSLIQPGWQISTINGMDISDIIGKLSENISRDGYNNTAPYNEAVQSFRPQYAFQLGTPDTFEIEFITASGQKQRVVLPASTNKDLTEKANGTRKTRENHFYYRDDPPLSFSIDENYGIMRISTFSKSDVRDSKQNFKKFYKASFTELAEAQIDHLIIDLRGNGGGDPMPTMDLFSYLHPKPFTFYDSVYSYTQKFPDKSYFPFTSKIVKALYPLVFRKKVGKYYPNFIAKLAGLKGLNVHKPKKNQFAGKVYVLTDHRSFSATGEMSAIFKEYDRATFIGEEPGGNPNQNTSGLTELMILPNSKVQWVFPFWLWKMNVTFENTGHGVIPDHIVLPSIEDMLQNNDRALNFTIDLIEASNN